LNPLEAVYDVRLIITAIFTNSSGFAPKAEPKKAAKDDPLLKVCFHCFNSEGLSEFHGVSRCAGCRETMERYGTITRDLLQSFFGLSKGEADKLPRGTGIAGVYRSIIYKCVIWLS
jgi:hypothetical protein